ncbi:DUF1223 domain-containing protein [Thalassococcus sp. CAU 1522]|uniref:DUF1223 domain-containing protein n=1 Tax=Thalassococcus arenae TaxID=2851652 RepID=A0ABS6NCI9_9RHOB|nr:DUF1223 domain-containing protein [Thalassococcus arenae]MBV2361260.1 DUF1223 domain-containing protein [Thalassococcus arenae]
MRQIGQWIFAFCVAAAGLAPVAAKAQANPVVVELFTSQGCSSCPPADEILGSLADRDDVIPLALHVDYWDYIGWKDSFAQPGFTKRQKGYAQTGGRRSIYTPQMVINGQEDVVGSHPMKVADLIQKHRESPKKAAVTLERRGNSLVIRAKANGQIAPCDIHLVRYKPSESVKIRRGENAGQTLAYSHIVKDWSVVGRWDGALDFETTVQINGSDPVVVLVQTPRYGPIIAAARLR